MMLITPLQVTKLRDKELESTTVGLTNLLKRYSKLGEMIMADTSYIKKVVEPWVREWLSKRFSGHHFESCILKLKQIKQTTPSNHEFDAVSNDGTIIAAIKGHSWKTSGGNLPAAKYASLYQELYFLSLVEARVKLLIFTNEEMYKDFTTRSRGKIADGIELVFCKLPASIQRQVQNVGEQASREMAKR